MPYFNSKARTILQALNKTRIGLTIYEISKQTGISWITIKKYLGQLEKKQIVINNSFRKNPRYKINFSIIYKNEKRKAAYIFLLIYFIIISLNFSQAISPNGANVSVIRTGTAPSNIASSVNAIAGNVTELNIFGYSTTQSWQGYFGNVSGVIQLGDSTGKIMYNWTAADPSGQVYASTNSTIIWSNIQCFNFTANGTFVDESGKGGQTNKAGTNLSRLEAMFNISHDAVDGVNETFIFQGEEGHRAFYTANNFFSRGQCPSTRIFDNTGTGVQGKFEEVLLYEPVTTSVVFAALLNKNLPGFDNGKYDFQMIVLENGRGTDTQTTTYFFFVELQ